MQICVPSPPPPPPPAEGISNCSTCVCMHLHSSVGRRGSEGAHSEPHSPGDRASDDADAVDVDAVWTTKFNSHRLPRGGQRLACAPRSTSLSPPHVHSSQVELFKAHLVCVGAVVGTICLHALAQERRGGEGEKASNEGPPFHYLFKIERHRDLSRGCMNHINRETRRRLRLHPAKLGGEGELAQTVA